MSCVSRVDSCLWLQDCYGRQTPTPLSTRPENKQHLTENGWTDGRFGILESNRTQIVLCSVLHIASVTFGRFCFKRGSCSCGTKQHGASLDYVFLQGWSCSNTREFLGNYLTTACYCSQPLFSTSLLSLHLFSVPSAAVDHWRLSSQQAAGPLCC